MIYQQVFEIRGEPFGESIREEYFPEGYAPWSIAWFCPRCGEVWAKIKVEGARYHVWTQLCDRHPHDGVWMTELPGSLWSSYERGYNEALPEPVLRREVELCFAAWRDDAADQGSAHQGARDADC